MSKRLSKYIAGFGNFFEKALIGLSAKSGGISIISFSSIIGTPVGIASASASFSLYLTTGIVKNYWKQQEIKRRNIIRFLR